tara:strand:+ start:1007 stop:1459 length:453 start_codon:yes stop_codon:yes gene_type:complete
MKIHNEDLVKSTDNLSLLQRIIICFDSEQVYWDWSNVEKFLPISYENCIPEAPTDCNPQNVQRDGYVLERLSSFSSVAPVVRDNLKEIIHQLKLKAGEDIELLPLSYVVYDNQTLGERVAKLWELQESLKSHIQTLLTYRTRHYQHTIKS